MAPSLLPGDDTRRLNAAGIRMMMIGANLGSLGKLADAIGVDKSNLSRCMRPKATQGPSWPMVEGMLALWPLARLDLLVRRPGEEDDPARYGLTEDDMTADLDPGD